MNLAKSGLKNYFRMAKIEKKTIPKRINMIFFKTKIYS